MQEAQHYLQKLGVSEETLDYFIRISMAHGALGAKLTGGGRGGCMIALANDKDSAQKIAEALEEAGAYKTWIQFLGE